MQVHGYHLMLAAGRALPPWEIAGDWYDRVYLDAVAAIRREGLDAACAKATDADRFLWVYQRRRELFPDCGCPPLEETARHLTENGRKRPRPGLRRLLRVRGQTAGGIGTR